MYTRERFIVAGPPAIVGPLVETLARDPQATLVDVAPGGPAGLERFVVAAPPPTVRRPSRRPSGALTYRA